jgi:hypothetical protein
MQTGRCYYGETRRFDGGGCVCSAGYELDQSGERCRTCPHGKDSRPLTSSADGTLGCTLCANGFYRPDPQDEPCEPCGSLVGVTCSSNATIESLNLTQGYWRHSADALQTYSCRSEYGAQDWTPCEGGVLPGNDGDGYCKRGYRGPRCELCNASSQYFDTFDARCHDCGNVAVNATLFYSVGSSTTARARRWSCCPKAHKKLLKKLRSAHKLWKRAGLRYKVKVTIGMYQCLTAVPVVFDVSVPLGMEDSKRLLHLLEYMAHLGIDMAIPGACLGSYEKRLVLVSCWPIVLLLLVAVAYAGKEVAQQQLGKSLPVIASRGTRRAAVRVLKPRHLTRRAAVTSGLRKALPLTLLITFILVPSTATTIFKTFLCIPFQYSYSDKDQVGVDDMSVRRYMFDDVSVRCGSDEYTAMRRTALVFTALWPIGVPAVYLMLLWASHDAIRDGTPSSLSRATAFLWEDYAPRWFWWEPIEMCRKLALTGWVLLLEEEYEQARALVALLVSIAFLALHLSVQPMKR